MRVGDLVTIVPVVARDNDQKSSKGRPEGLFFDDFGDTVAILKDRRWLVCHFRPMASVVIFDRAEDSASI
jgi:hypothetical protein